MNFLMEASSKGSSLHLRSKKQKAAPLSLLSPPKPWPGSKGTEHLAESLGLSDMSSVFALFLSHIPTWGGEGRGGGTCQRRELKKKKKPDKEHFGECRDFYL